MTSFRLLITGGAGYIGGSLLQTLLANKDQILPREDIVAVARSNEQVAALSRLGVKAVQVDLRDTKALKEVIETHGVNIIVHTANSLDAALVTSIVRTLGERARRHGEKAYFIHTSGSSAFFESTGFPPLVTDNSEKIFQAEKEQADSFPIRKTDVAVVENAKELGVASFIVVPPVVYGTGSGPWNRYSVVLPIAIKAFASQGAVYRFPENTIVQAAHITDMVSVYELLIAQIVNGQAPDQDERGYYFAFSHKFEWEKATIGLHAALTARGLVKTTDIEPWPSDEYAATALGVSPKFVRPLWNSGTNVTSAARQKLGWSPQWAEKDFYDALDQEVADVLADPEVRSSLVQALKSGG